ncbi:MAG: hypothetical protein RPR97_16675 [Colwellia sp.]
MAQLETHDRAQAVTLPDNLHWPGEFAGWRPLAQKTLTALDGTPITQASPLSAGRPIELVDFWLKRPAIETLYAWAASAAQYYLTLPDGREFLVIFDDAAPLDAAPVYETAAPSAATDYLVNHLKLVSQPG